MVDHTESDGAVDVELIRPGRAAKLLGVTVDTLARYDREGIVDAVWTPGGHRRYRADQIDKLVRLGPASARRTAFGQFTRRFPGSDNGAA